MVAGRRLSLLAERRALDPPASEQSGRGAFVPLLRHRGAVDAIRRAAEYFDPDVRVQLDDREITSRDEIIELLSRVQPPPGGLIVEFVNITITMAADQESAAVGLTAKLRRRTTKGVSTLDERIADVTMRKVDDDWVISSAVLRPKQLRGCSTARHFRRRDRRPWRRLVRLSLVVGRLKGVPSDSPTRRRSRFPSPPASRSTRPCPRLRCRSASRPAWRGRWRARRWSACGESCPAA